MSTHTKKLEGLKSVSNVIFPEVPQVKHILQDIVIDVT